MPVITCIQLAWNGDALPMLPRYHRVAIGPDPAHPFGRKGLALARAWGRLSKPDMAGMLIVDGDVAIDPGDHAAMLAAIDLAPAVVHVAPVKLWPVSTDFPAWRWAHWTGGNGQARQGDPQACRSPDFFTFCFTYLPRALIEAAAGAGLEQWEWPEVDTKMAATAARAGIAASVVGGCWPKHLHF
jgi:hypothetical protein